MAEKILKEEARIFAQRFFSRFGMWKFTRRELIQIGYRAGYRIGYCAEHVKIADERTENDYINR